MEKDNKKSTSGSSQENKQRNIGRREVLKTLATVPLLGAMAYGAVRTRRTKLLNRDISDVFKLSNANAVYLQAGGRQIRIGLIGFGIRGKQLMRAIGFAEPSYIDTLIEAKKNNSDDTRYDEFKEQDDLNVVINGVCDIFDVYSEAARLTGSNIYSEKPLTWTVPETYLLRSTIKETGVVFQLGHQGRQTASYQKAAEIIKNDLLGHVNLIEVCTNRNTPNGAWVYPIIEGSNPQTIDWKQFEGDETRIKEYEEYMRSSKLERYMGPDERSKFSLERFFRWRCWWDYSTGLSGDLLTHEFDAVNQIMHVGIPASATSSGGVYFFKDGTHSS
jgi:predicted dehydrogenase